MKFNCYLEKLNYFYRCFLMISLYFRNQLNVFYEAANRLGLLFNLGKTKTGGYLARAESWYYGSKHVSVAGLINTLV